MICTFLVVKSTCQKGELSLIDTHKCHRNGYVCSIGDKEDCCDGKKIETRKCIPCDETRHKKPDGSEYIENGNCEYKKPNGNTDYAKFAIVIDRK